MPSESKEMLQKIIKTGLIVRVLVARINTGKRNITTKVKYCENTSLKIFLLNN